MMGWMRVWAAPAAVVATVALAGCNFNVTTPTNDPGLNAVADAMYRDLAADNIDAMIVRMSSANDPDQVRSQIPMLKKLIGEATPPAPKVVRFQKTVNNGTQYYSVLQDYAYADRVVHVATEFMAENGGWKVHAFNLNVVMTAQPTEPEVEPTAGAEPAPKA